MGGFLALTFGVPAPSAGQAAADLMPWVYVAGIVAFVVVVGLLAWRYRQRIGVFIQWGKWKLGITARNPTSPVESRQNDGGPPSHVDVTVSQSRAGGDIAGVGRDYVRDERIAHYEDRHQERHTHVHYQGGGAGAAASAASIAATRQVPAPPRDFVGREEEIGKLLGALRAGGAIIACTGMGGVGKTALAYVLAERLKQEFPDQILLDMRGLDPNPAPAEAAMRSLVQAFHPEAKLPDDPAKIADQYRSVLADKRALVLADNAFDRAQVERLVPPNPSALLVTARNIFALPGCLSTNLDVLPEGKAMDLVREICERVSEAQARQIAFLCGRLPLALRAAASLLAVERDRDVAGYIKDLQDEDKRLETIGREGVPLGVEATFGLSYRALEEQPQRVFAWLSVFRGTFDGEAAEAVAQDPGHGALSLLVRRSLVEYEEKTGRYRLHDLARLFAARRAGKDGLVAAERHAQHYCRVLRGAGQLYLMGGPNQWEGLRLFDAERENIEAGQTWAAALWERKEAARRLASAYPDVGAYVLDLRLTPTQRTPWLETAISAARKGGDKAAEGNHLGNLGVAYAALGETRRAIEYYEQQLKIARQIGDRRGEGHALGNLGLAYADLGETRRAIEYYDQGLKIDREIGDRRGEGADLGNLGNAYAALGQMRKAIDYFEKHLQIAREIGDRRGEGADLWNMALAYEKVGDPAKAAELARAALAIFEAIEDPGAEKVRHGLERFKEAAK